MIAACVDAAAAAADKLAIGPPAPWVRPVATPEAGGKPDEAAVKVLLQDEQYDLQPGRQGRYFETMYRIQTPQGLAAGQVGLSWNPDIQSATVHKLVIRRGAQVIDVLAGGQTFTVVRRESNLENAVLDGVLTATIQPEGLQVGDVVDFAATIVSSDPAVGRHIEQGGAMWNGVPIAHAHLRAQWPAAVAMQLRETGGLPALKPQRKDGLASIELSLDDLQPVPAPKGAPMRYQYGRIIEMTDFAGWSGLAELMAPLYAKAATLPPQGPLQAELATIRAGSPDPKARAAAALRLVQDRVRYVFLGMNDGGLVPADAETTWSRRFGDCKAKTALLLALLRALDIDAQPMVVSSGLGDGLDRRLPLVALFDHILVRATIAGKTYWLDGTRPGDRDLDAIAVPAFRWGLPLVAGTAALVPIMPAPLSQPDTDIAVRIDASGGVTLPAPAHVERLIRGDAAVGTNMSLDNMTADARDRSLRAFWKEKYDFIEVKTTSSSFDPARRELKLVMDGTAKLDWDNGFYEADGVGVGYKPDFAREPGPDRDAPYAVAFPFYTRVAETILLPPRRGAFTIDKTKSEVDRTVAGIAYHRHAEIAGDRFAVEETERSVAPEFPAADAPAADSMLRALNKQTVYLRMPSDYVKTKAELDAAVAVVPTTADGVIDRGNALMVQSRFDDAIADFTKALALDPKNVWALADRGIAHVSKREKAAAEKDLDAAAAIDPNNAVILRARGMLAMDAGSYKDAVAAFTSSLGAEPDNLFTLERRSEAHMALGETDLAIADLDKVLAIDPKNVRALTGRAFVRVQQGETALAKSDLDAAVALGPNDPAVVLLRAGLAMQAGEFKDAVALITPLIQTKPDNALVLSTRAQAYAGLGETDLALADATAALKLDPKIDSLYVLRANMLRRTGKREEAARQADALLAAHPDSSFAQVAAGKIYAAFGKRTEAMQAFDRALKLKPEAYIYLNRATVRDKSDVAGRQADVDLALKLDPAFVPALLSKAALQSERGDFQGAVATLSAAPATGEGKASVLLERGFAYARSGQVALAERDFAAVRAQARTALELNNICWRKATTGVALESALEDCNGALAKEPAEPATLDSRGFVELRLGRIDAAIADYDKALALRPDQAGSLFGRAAAEARKGDSAKSRSDLAAALKADPHVRSEYEGYGVTIPAASATAAAHAS